VYAALIPAGPLHPVDAAWGLAVGLLVAGLARRDVGRWFALVPAGMVGVVTVLRGNELLDGYLDRPDTATALGVTLSVLVVACVGPSPVAAAVPAALAALVGVWVIVPDTEVPHIAAAFLVGAALRMPREIRTRLSGTLVLFPLAAATAGSVARSERLGPAVLLGGFAWLVAQLIGVELRRSKRRQRAGTPTTVAPGATSTTTTAPAPTTAP
jgi:hypothetical protein